MIINLKYLVNRYETSKKAKQIFSDSFKFNFEYFQLINLIQ